MSDTKTIELLRKRNIQMQEELDKLKNLSIRHNDDSENKKVTNLITELEDIRKEWMKVLEDREEYRGLIEDLRSIRETFGKI